MKTGRRAVKTVIIAVGVGAAASGIGLVSGLIERDHAFTIDRFDQEVVVAADGTTRVVEDLDVTFTTERRGIFRDLDRSTPFPSHGGFHDFTVDQGDPGQPWNHVIESGPTGPRIRIGQVDRWLTPGTYRYRIGYLAPSWYYELTDDRGTVEVRIDSPGYDWPTSIGPTTIDVEVPGPIRDASCVEGPRRTIRSCAAAPEVDGNRARFRVGPFADQQGATVAVRLDRDAFGPAAQVPTFDATPLERVRGIPPLPLDRPQAALLLVVLLAIPLLAFEKWSAWGYYRDELTDPRLHDREQPTALPAPPFGFRPPEVAGLLLEHGDGQRLFLATLVDLDQRGLITSTSRTSEGRWLSRDKEELTVHPGLTADAAHPTDAELIDALLPGGHPATFDGEYDAEVAERVKRVQRILTARAKTVYDTHGFTHERGGLIGQGWFRVVLLIGYLLLAAATTAAVVLLTPLHPATGAIIAALVLIGWGLAAYLWRFHRLPLNSAGRDAMGQARSFEEFVRSVEGEQLEWAAGQRGIDHHHPAVSLLPYAIVLGLADSWYDRFGSVMRELAATAAGAAATAGSSWWMSQSSFRGVSTASSGTSTAPSSSGGGGGGSGGGGGGGGSW